MRLLHWPLPIHVHVEWPKFVQRMLARAIEPVIVDKVRLRHLIDSEQGEPDFLIAVLEFNDEQADARSPNFVDLDQLESSLTENGTFFIWTCSCGAPGCAGLFDGVLVAHEGENTTWHDIDCKRKFRFKSRDLRNAFDRGIIDGQSHLKERPNLEPVPDQNRSAYQARGHDASEPR